MLWFGKIFLYAKRSWQNHRNTTNTRGMEGALTTSEFGYTLSGTPLDSYLTFKYILCPLHFNTFMNSLFLLPAYTFSIKRARSRVTNRPYTRQHSRIRFKITQSFLILYHLKCCVCFLHTLLLLILLFLLLFVVKKCTNEIALTSHRHFTHRENIVKIRFLPVSRERQRDQRGRFSREGRNSCPNEPGIYVSIEAWRHFDGIICRIQSYTRRFRRILCTIRPLRHRIFSRRI